jgi:solute:Na+ symporter, SSS family
MAEPVGHLAAADMLMVVGYFVLMLGIGAYFYGRMRRMKDYFSGGNRIPWWLSGVSFYMSSFSVAAFVFYPGLCYRHGWVGVTLLWVAVPATIFSVMLFGVKWRRARIDSPVEYLETRYSPLLRQLFTWHGVPVKLIDDGIKLFATGTFISVAAGIDIQYSILFAGGIILVYTFMGGLWAVTVTDFIQFVVLAAGILIILPLSIMRAGGMGTILAETPPGFFRLTSEEFGWSYVIPLILLYALAWSSINWSLIQRYYCVPRERDAIKVGWLVVALYIVGPPLMFFPAIAATQFVPELEDAGRIYPILCTQLLPAGMLGLAVSAMFAATMSTLSSDYNVSAGVLTNDVYRRLIRPEAGERELLLVGRLMTLLIGVLALLAAFIMSRGTAEGLFRTMVTLFGVATAPVALPMLLGLVSRRVTNLGAVLGFLAGIILGLALFFLLPQAGVTLGNVTLKTEIALFLSTSIVTLGVIGIVSWLWPANAFAQARTDAFIERLHVPIGRLPEDRESGQVDASLSPFRVVGVAVALIGLLMLGVLPWVPRGTDFQLVLGLGVFLLVIGGLAALATSRPAAGEAVMTEESAGEEP